MADEAFGTQAHREHMGASLTLIYVSHGHIHIMLLISA
jgi:hypothetical protein